MVDPIKNLELFNAHQESTRKQFEFLCKSIFLIAGAALSLSFNLFLGEQAPLLSCSQAYLLKGAWVGFLLSMIGLMTSFVIMIFRDYRFGEKWRKSFSNKQVDISGTPRFTDALMWIFGILSLFAFFSGLAALAWVSSQLIKVS